MKKICIFILILFLLPMLVNCNGRIQGTVSKSTARAAVEDSPYLASVRVSVDASVGESQTAPDYDVYTNQNGYYVFEGLEPGMYDVTFTAIKYGNVTATVYYVNVEANITAPISISIPVPTSPSIVIAHSGLEYGVSGSSITCEISANVINTGDCPVYGILATASVKEDGGALIIQVSGDATPDPVEPYTTSIVTIAGIPCGDKTPVSVDWTVSYSIATPTVWSIK